MAAIFYSYGDYDFAAGTVDVRILRNVELNEAGVPYKQKVSWEWFGQVLDTDQDALTTKILALEAAFNLQYQDVRCRFADDNAATAHGQLNRNTIGGIITHGVNWDQGPGQYTTYRDFSIRLEWHVPVTGLLANTALISFDESITFTGGGPEVVENLSLEGPVYYEVVHAYTPFRAIQFGRIVGRFAYPALPRPLWPQAQKVNLTEITEGTPRPVGGSGLAKYEGFPRSYRYEFSSPTPLVQLPNVWPL